MTNFVEKFISLFSVLTCLSVISGNPVSGADLPQTSPEPVPATQSDAAPSMAKPDSVSAPVQGSENKNPTGSAETLPAADGGAAIPIPIPVPVPAQNAAQAKVPPPSGKPQIGVQMPAYKQLAWFLRINEPASVARVKSAEAKMRRHLAAGGMDPNIDIDDAMALGKPVINLSLKKHVGGNILAHGFCLQAHLCQYQRLPSGMIKLVRFARIGESPEVYSGADFEDKAVMLVDAYLSARHHQIKEQAMAGKKPAAKGKKTR